MQNLSVETISSFETFLSLENEWNELLKKSYNNSLFLRHEWFRIWWQNFGDKKELNVLLAKDREELVGIAPLMLVKEKVGQRRPFAVRQVRFIENGEAPYLDFIVKEKRAEILTSFLTYLECNRNEWDIIVLKNIPEDSILFESFSNTRVLNGLKLRIRNTIHLPFLKTNLDWKTYFASRSKRFRGAIRNSRNKIQKFGSVNIEKIIDNKDCQTALSCVWDISRNSWKNGINAAIASNESRKKFFKEFSTIACKNDWLNLWLLSINDIPTAFEYHLVYDNKDYALRSEFNEIYRNCSPGFVLDTYIVEDLFKNGVGKYEMGPTADRYKMRWTEAFAKNKVVFIFNTNYFSILLDFIECKLLQPLSQLSWLNLKKNIRIQKAKNDYKNLGLMRFFKQGLRKTISDIYLTNHAIWFKRQLNEKIIDYSPKIEAKIQFDRQKETLQWIKSFGKDWMYNAREIEIAKQENHNIVGVTRKGKIIGYIKLGFNRVYVQDYEQVIYFSSQKAFIYDTFIQPELRRQGLAKYLITESIKYLKDKGFVEVICHIPQWNKASINAYKRVGFESVKGIRFVKVLGLRFFSSRPEKI